MMWHAEVNITACLWEMIEKLIVVYRRDPWRTPGNSID